MNQGKSKKKDNFLEKVSSEDLDYDMMRHFLKYDRKFILWVVKNMKRLLRAATPTELIVGKYLYHSRVIFVPQAPFVFDLDGEPKCYFADFYIPALNVIVEVDGHSHERPANAEYDSVRDGLFMEAGIGTIRIPSGMVKTKEYKKLIPIPEERFLRPEKVTVIPEDEGMAAKERMLRGALKNRRAKK